MFTHSYRGNKISRPNIDATDIKHTKSSTSILTSKAKSKIELIELTHIVQELDVVLRVPFEMYYVGHRYQDIAEILNLPLNTVKSNILSARKELKAAIDSQYHYSENSAIL